jgi:hypothetical protein
MSYKNIFLFFNFYNLMRILNNTSYLFKKPLIFYKVSYEFFENKVIFFWEIIAIKCYFLAFLIKRIY